MKLAVKVERHRQVEEVKLTELARLAVVARAVVAAVLVLIVAVASQLGWEFESFVQSQSPSGVPQLAQASENWTRSAEEAAHS